MTSYPPPPGASPGENPPPTGASSQPTGASSQPTGAYPPPTGAYPPPPPPGTAAQPGPQFGPPPGQPPFPASTPVPPPPPGTAPVAKAPPIAWLIPLAALLAVIGLFTPWFKPHADKGSQTVSFDSLYSFKDGKIGLVAPIALVVLAITVIGLLQGKVRGRLAGSADPVRTTGKYAIGVGVVSLVCLAIAWFLVTTQYKFELSGSEYSWSDFESRLKAAGATLSRGPQLGFWLTLAGALLAIVAGIVLLVQAKPVEARPKPAVLPPPPGAYPPPSGGYPPPPAGPAPLSLDKQPPTA